MMFTTISLFIVPVLMIVVLSALLITGKWVDRPLGLSLLGVFGVLFGGPSAMVMLGAQADEPAVAVSGRALNDPVEVLSVDAEEGSASSSSESSELPGWALQEKQLEGDVHTVVVSSGHHQRPRERDLKLQEELKRATDEYIAWHIGHPAAPTVMNFDERYINGRLRSHEHNYEGTRDFGPPLGTLHVSYTMLNFNQRFRQELDRRWQEAVAKTRLLYTALVGGAALTLLGVIFSYFRLDNATRGFYTGRLQFVAVTAILVLITVGVLAARWIPWM